MCQVRDGSLLGLPHEEACPKPESLMSSLDQGHKSCPFMTTQHVHAYTFAHLSFQKKKKKNEIKRTYTHLEKTAQQQLILTKY